MSDEDRPATELRIWLPVDAEHPAIEAIVDFAMSHVQDAFGLDAIMSSETKPESEWYPPREDWRAALRAGLACSLPELNAAARRLREAL